MRKGFTRFLITAIMLLCMTGFVFANGSAEGEGDEGYFIGVSMPTTQGGFMGALTDGIVGRFTEAGLKVEVADAELSPAKQIEQIENMIILGADAIIIAAVDPSGVTDVIKKAMAKDIKIFAFSQKTEVYDKYAGTDNVATGERIAEMATIWIDKNYPDAAPGSINVAIFENRDLPDMAARADGMHKITEFTDKVKITSVVGVNGSPVDAQEKAENLFLTNSDIDVVLAYNTDTASGINANVMALNSQIDDKENFAIFSCDWSDLAQQLLEESVDNTSVVRGVIQMGEGFGAMIADVYKFTMETLESENYDKDSYTTLNMVTADNLADMVH